MKLQADPFDAHSISAYGPGWIRLGRGAEAETISASVVLDARGARQAWACRSFAELTAAHFAQLAELDAEIVLFGSGQRNRFPPPAWLQPLVARSICLETMDSAAACRTYNVLAAEGRHVVLALLLEPGTDADPGRPREA